MRFGIFIGGATYKDVIPKIVVATEKFGYDSFWVSDHLFLPDHFYKAVGMNPEKGECPLLEAWTTLAAAAALTKRVKLGIGVTPIPMRNPSILAKEAATVDYFSNGRLIFGCGVGWHQREFEAYGIPWDTYKVRFEKMLEGLDIIKKLWTAPFSSFNGRYYQLKNAPLWPKPIGKPHPPIWFGGTSDSIMRAVAKYGSGWVPYCFSPREFEFQHEKLKKVLKEEGRSPDEITTACVVLAHLESNSQKAYEFAKPIIKLRGTRTLTSEKWEEGLERCVIGSPEECTSKIEEYRKVGVQHLLFEMIHPKQVYRQVRKFGSKVISAFR